MRVYARVIFHLLSTFCLLPCAFSRFVAGEHWDEDKWRAGAGENETVRNEIYDVT